MSTTKSQFLGLRMYPLYGGNLHGDFSTGHLDLVFSPRLPGAQ